MTEGAIQRQANEAQARAGDQEDLARLTQPMPVLDPWPARAGIIVLGVIAVLCILTLVVVSLELPATGELAGGGGEDGSAPTAPGEEVVGATTTTLTIGGLRLIASLVGVLAGTSIGALAGLLIIARHNPMPVMRPDIKEGNGYKT